MPIELQNSLTIVGENGVTASNSGVGFDGTEPMVQEISLGNDIRTTGNVQFNQMTSSNYLLDTLTLTGNGSWNSNFTNTGNTIVTGNLTIPTNATIGGTVIAEKFATELTSSGVIFNSGSTIFGNDIDDTHYVTGSVYNSGSISLLGYNINEISNDTSLTDGSTTSLVTENAIKSYTDTIIGSVGDPSSTDLYLRKNFTKVASSITNNTASFTAVTASSPDGVTSTNENDFIFFINGNVMEHDALTIQQAGSSFYLKVDTDSIGYVLESDDEILSWGKWNN